MVAKHDKCRHHVSCVYLIGKIVTRIEYVSSRYITIDQYIVVYCLIIVVFKFISRHVLIVVVRLYNLDVLTCKNENMLCNFDSKRRDMYSYGIMHD